ARCCCHHRRRARPRWAATGPGNHPRSAAMMVRSAFRDLQWRRRRVSIAILGTSLVFAITLLLTGLSNGFEGEADRPVEHLQVDTWAVRSGAAGPFLGQPPLPAGAVAAVLGAPGARQAT